jgi:hypothetical protein
VVIPREVENSRTLEVESYIIGIGELIEKVAGVRTLVAARAIISAAHAAARADPLIRPVVPLPVSIQAHGDHQRLGCLTLQNCKKIANPKIASEIKYKREPAS